MSNVTFVRVVPAVLAAALLAVTAGCGSTREAGNAAAVVPADVAAYVSVDTSFQGGQWRAVRDLLAKFPDGEGSLEELLDKAAENVGLENGEGLRTVLGPEVGIAVLDVPTEPGAETPVVLLTQPGDEDAFRQLFEDGKAAFAEVNGWEVVAPDEATLDRFRSSLDGPSLEGSEAFDATMDDLDPDALVHAYVNAQAILRSFAGASALSGTLPMLGGAQAHGSELGSIGMAVSAEDDGLRLDGRAVAPEGADSGPVSEPYRSELVEEVPGGVLAFASVDGIGKAFGQANGESEGLLPFDFGALAELFSGETAVYVRPGAPQPTVTIVTEVDDEAAALETAQGLLGLAGAQKDKFSLDAFDGLLVASTSKDEIAALRGDGPRLDQDDAFEHAADQAGLPDETTGFGYVDLQALIPLVLGIAPVPDPVPEVNEYLEPLGSVVFWGGTAGDVQEFSLFVGIE